MLAHGGAITGDELLLIGSALAVVLLVVPTWVRRLLHHPAPDRREKAGKKST